MIAAELAELLEPLERFEAIRRRAARLGGRLADLSYANPYARVGEAARAVLRETLEEERALDLQYTPFGGATLARRAAAESLRACHGLAYAFHDLVLTPGAMSALRLALRVAGGPGAEVVIPVPCWLDYPLYARALGMRPRLVRLAEGGFELDVGAVADAIGPATAAVLLSQPANPTGRSYSPVALGELADALRGAADRHGGKLTLIADETHRDFVAPGAHTSPTAHYDRTLSVYSFGKYHFMQGQRLGYVAVSPRHPERRETAEELVRWTRVDAIATPTALMQRALPRLLSLEHDHAWISTGRERVVAELRGAGYEVVEPDATMFVYARTPDRAGDDFAFVEQLARRGLLVLPAAVFHHAGYFRLSLTGSEPMLGRGLEILAEEAGA